MALMRTGFPLPSGKAAGAVPGGNGERDAERVSGKIGRGNSPVNAHFRGGKPPGEQRAGIRRERGIYCLNRDSSDYRIIPMQACRAPHARDESCKSLNPGSGIFPILCELSVKVTVCHLLPEGE
jgi:hypothetical protein